MRTNTPQGDYTATATVQAPDVSADFQQVGLYAYVDDNNYVKADLGWIDGRRAIEFITESGAQLGTRASVALDPDTARLRLVRHASSITGEYSSDGQTWYPLATASARAWTAGSRTASSVYASSPASLRISALAAA